MMRRFFQSKRVKDSHDILTYHYKEQCKLLRKIHTTMPNACSLHDQPSMRVKANGAIILNQSYHTSMSLDWTPVIISRHVSYNGEDQDDTYQEVLNNDNIDHSEYASMKECAFLSAAPLRRPSSH